MKYALHFERLISQSNVIKHKRHVLEAFLSDPYDALFDDESHQRSINCILSEMHDTFEDLDIHAPIPDKTFAMFDPSNFTYKASGNSSAIYILYGQSILSHIVKTEELQPFVKLCVEKICDLSEDSIVPIMYAVFMEKYFDDFTNMIGGSYSHEQLHELGNILTRSIMYDYGLHLFFLEIEKNHFYDLNVLSLGETLIESIILKRGVKVMMYLEYIEKQEYPEDMWEVYAFLKTPKGKHITNPRKLTTRNISTNMVMIKTRKSVRKRHRKTRKQSRLFLHNR